MQTEKNVIAITDEMPFVVDLADFPHGELVSTRKDAEYDIEFYSVPDGVQVVSYDESTGTPVFHDVKYWSMHRGKQVEIVNLDDGRQIITDNDPRAVYGIPTKCDGLKFDRFTPSDAMDMGVMVPVSNKPIASKVEGLFYDFSDGAIKPEDGPRCVRLGYDFGQFIGIMAGDGWSNVQNHVSLSDSEGFNAKFVEGFIKSGPYHSFYTTSRECKLENSPSRYGDTVRYELNAGDTTFGVRIKELVDGHRDETTSGSANKRLPVWYQFAGKDFLLGLVNGLIATDGTVCMTHGKSKPQLQISFTSTSLRLVREFRRCCQLLGVRSTISYSKRTSGENDSWICTVSTVDAKKTDLLSRCCHDRKRGVFASADVDLSPQFVRNDIIPFPKGVADRLVKIVPAAKVSGVDLDSLGEAEKSRRLRYNATAINLRDHAGKGFITRFLVKRIADMGDEIADRNMAAFVHGMDMLNEIGHRFDAFLESDSGGSRRSWKVDVTKDEMNTLSSMQASVKSVGGKAWEDDARPVSNALSIARRNGSITWGQLELLRSFMSKHDRPNTKLRDSDDLAILKKLADSDVNWTGIASVEKTGHVETGYDLTVPGPDTFMSDDGIVLSNTVNIHVPASDKAVKQALGKMLPSKNLFSLTDMKSVRYKPEKEQISGLWALTMGRTRKPTRYFNSKAEAIAAYRNGEIGPNDPIEIKEV